ncbi:MAG: hypothetical protein ACJ79H_13935 [Myxococcales bacterium]
MDPASTAALAILMKGLAPVLVALISFGLPAFIVYTVKHFKLRHRELELEAELHGKQTQARLAAIEARLGTLETALGALVRGPVPAALQDRRSLLEARSSSSAEAPAESDPQGVRTR